MRRQLGAISKFGQIAARLRTRARRSRRIKSSIKYARHPTEVRVGASPTAIAARWNRDRRDRSYTGLTSQPDCSVVRVESDRMGNLEAGNLALCGHPIDFLDRDIQYPSDFLYAESFFLAFDDFGQDHQFLRYSREERDWFADHLAKWRFGQISRDLLFSKKFGAGSNFSGAARSFERDDCRERNPDRPC